MPAMKKSVICLFAILLVFTASIASAQVVDQVDSLVQAQQDGRPIPVLSTQNSEMDVNMAYGIQRAFVKKMLLNDTVAGFKAGLTSEAGQKKFGVDAPLCGVLLSSGALDGEVTLDSSAFNLLMLETEIGFVVGTAITEPLADAAALKTHIKAVVPVIEVPDLGFADMKQLKGVDIIAANASAKQFIVGEERAVDGIDLNAVVVTLGRDGEEVNVGKGTDALGDQWKAALWLVNTTLEHGWTLQPGQVIISGALGNMIPGKPGKYVADFGDFGTIKFAVQ